MKKLLVFSLLIFLYQNNIQAQVPAMQPAPEQLPQRKPLLLQTMVTHKGKPNAIIVTPNIPQFKKLASQVQLAVKAATGATLEIITSEKIVNKRGEFAAGDPQKNLIVLGNLETNGLIAHLYFRAYCSVDANYPGTGGYVVQTVSDPWGNGANAIILGGSDATGIAKAVTHFCANLPKGSTLNIPRKLRAQVGKNYKAADLTDAEIADILVKSTADFKNGKHNGLFVPIVKAGINYKLTGKEGQAKLFRDLLFLEYDLRYKFPNDFDSPWGGGADMQFAPLMGALDNVEESPSLSDADRHKIMDILMEYIHFYEHYAYMSAFKTPIIRHNHHTFPGQGFSAAGRYFGKYYPGFADAAKWQKMGDDCFKVQEQSWKSQENSSAYVGLAMSHMIYYTTTRPDFSWYNSGRANIAGDLAIMTMDNLGSQCAFGDMEGYNPTSHHTLWNSLVTIERNGRYAWAIHKARGVIKKTLDEIDSMQVHVAPIVPTDLLGTKYMQVDSLFFVSLNGTGKTAGKVPREETFDKISFRSTFDPMGQYLAIEGINTGYHSHKDGNSVLRLSDHGRIWLADGDYIKSSAKYHNTLLIFKEGEATPMPLFIKRDIIADLPNVGMTRTTMLDYGGTDWTRNIIWDKERAFVFIDEVKANSTASYSIRTLWHTLGKPSFNGNMFNLTQQGQSFAIQNLDGSQLRNFRDEETGKNWQLYKFADPVINSLQQIRTTTLRSGDKLYVMNVMSADAEGKTPIAAVRVSESSLLLGSGATQALIGVGNIKLKGLEANTSLYRISRERIALAGVTELSLNDKKVFKSDGPVSVELTTTGLTFSAEKATKLTFYGVKGSLLLDNKLVKPGKGNGEYTISLPAGHHSISGIAIPKGFAIAFPKAAPVKSDVTINLGIGQLIEKAQFAPDKLTGTRPFAAGTEGMCAAGNNGVLYALTNDAKVRWKYTVGGIISAVWTGKLAKDAPERIVAGNIDGRVVVLDQTGKLLWEQQIPFYRNARAPVYFAAANLNGDGNKALVAGVNNWYTYTFDISGKLVWKFLVTHPSSTGAVADIDGDGKDEVLTGTVYYSWNAVTPDGKAKWAIRGGPYANAIAAADLTGDGKKTSFFAGGDGYLYVVEADGKRPWTYSTGDGATAIGFMDVDGDGKKEILLTSLSNNLVALKPDGKPLWRRDLGEPILAMVQTDVNGDGKPEIVIGTIDGHVIALDNNGQPMAHWATSGSVDKLTVLANGQIAAATSTGRVVILGMK
jgi:hypothetical protein